MTKFDTISIVGLGYIGLPLAVELACRGHVVYGFDIDQKVVTDTNNATTHYNEPHLSERLLQARASNKLIASNILKPADVFVIAVPTPLIKNSEYEHAPDLTYVRNAIRSISQVLENNNLIILESTVPVGTTDLIKTWLKEENPDFQKVSNSVLETLDIAFCPERILPGDALNELINNDRTVGGITEKAASRAAKFYENFVNGKITTTNARTAEMVKLVENSFRDVNIAFANEISMIASKYDIDVRTLIEMANTHPRVNILQPGPGVGGHCIAIDPWFLVHDNELDSRLIKTARQTNLKKTNWTIRRIEHNIDELSNKNTNNLKICFLGLSYKKNVDDLRESPASKIVEHFSTTLPFDISVIEPHILELPKSFDENVALVRLEDLHNFDLIIKLVDHDCFADLKNIKADTVLDYS
ncbi:UDP-N-acetyl-D-mannosamine dehydrogenase [Planktomarina temperata]|nr:UDP-N-acetyl-D-mannosamine dehydrogenase [Planktomarina temperata]